MTDTKDLHNICVVWHVQYETVAVHLYVQINGTLLTMQMQATLYCAALHYATLYYATLYCATLHYATLRYATLYCATLYGATLYCASTSHTLLRYT